MQSQEDLWLKAAQALTNIIKQIIEFAKMVPGFMRFNQDDQIVLLKKGKSSPHRRPKRFKKVQAKKKTREIK